MQILQLRHKSKQNRNPVNQPKKAIKSSTTILKEEMVSCTLHHVHTLHQKEGKYGDGTDMAENVVLKSSYSTYPHTLIEENGFI